MNFYRFVLAGLRELKEAAFPMGDSYQCLVFPNVHKEDAGACIKKAVDFLITKQIISPKKTHCILSDSELGYPPGKNAEVVVEGNYQFLDSHPNGVGLIAEKTVFHGSGNGPPQFRCQECDAHFRDEPRFPEETGGREFIEKWVQCVGHWWDSKTDEKKEIMCPQCGWSARFDLWPCEFPWAVGYCGLEFWNWPLIKSELISRLQLFTGEKVVRVFGRV